LNGKPANQERHLKKTHTDNKTKSNGGGKYEKIISMLLYPEIH
jgi:hypothetical protein